MILSGVDLANGKPLVVKMLPTSEVHLMKAFVAEVNAVTLLGTSQQPEVPLVPTEVRRDDGDHLRTDSAHPRIQY